MVEHGGVWGWYVSLWSESEHLSCNVSPGATCNLDEDDGGDGGDESEDDANEEDVDDDDVDANE